MCVIQSCILKLFNVIKLIKVIPLRMSEISALDTTKQDSTVFLIIQLLKTLSLDEIDISYTVAYSEGHPTGGRNGFEADEYTPSLKRFVACGVQLPSCVIVDLVNQCQLLTSLVLCGVRSLNDYLLSEVKIKTGNFRQFDGQFYLQNLDFVGIIFPSKQILLKLSKF